MYELLRFILCCFILIAHYVFGLVLCLAQRYKKTALENPNAVLKSSEALKSITSNHVKHAYARFLSEVSYGYECFQA